jgi:hypothetical protein
MMVIIRPGLKVVIQLRTQLLKRIQMVQELIMDQRQKVLSLVSESNAWVSHKRSQRAWHNTLVIPKLGLTHVTQHKTLLLKRIQVELELITKKPKELSQVLVLNAWALLRDILTLMFNMMVINKTGLINVMLLKIHGLKRTQVELVLGMVQRLMVLSQVSELDAKVSLNSKKMM